MSTPRWRPRCCSSVGTTSPGVTLKLWGGESDSGCCSVSDVEDARRVAAQLGIPHYVFNFTDDFTANVVDPYVDAYASGRTPNPCVECNRAIKFGRLLDRAARARLRSPRHRSSRARACGAGEKYALARGADRAKDQSYVLYMLGQRELARSVFPVGELTKADVRAHAAAPRAPHRGQAREHGRLLREEGRPRPSSSTNGRRCAPVTSSTRAARCSVRTRVSRRSRSVSVAASVWRRANGVRRRHRSRAPRRSRSDRATSCCATTSRVRDVTFVDGAPGDGVLPRAGARAR